MSARVDGICIIKKYDLNSYARRKEKSFNRCRWRPREGDDGEGDDDDYSLLEQRMSLLLRQRLN